MHPRQAERVKVRPELPGKFPLRGNLSRKFRTFPLDSRCRGGARRASRAKARRARRKSSAHARAALARYKDNEKGTEMKEYEVYSDAGGILVGTKDCRVHIPNAYGDGITKIRVYESNEGFEPYRGTKRNLEFVTTVCGNRIEIPDYDCPSKEPWFDGTVHDWTPIVTLDGCYAIYAHDGEIDFRRLGDAIEV